ncbi:MAG: type III pantothenate kinase [Campylobacter sputorum]|uniref:type III pantothenate kinase n=1 Tax=Campylobacter sputorum TaxID=206 RepID=UPI000B784150|nr:type III pantothenate kinase [Campylobacter sputorum]ASM38251.1 pantothenate kinase, type III [Campylobacter sputorum bv. paraureolyticus LMG 11764]MDY6120097.1 type III pantothenate kinase [Campylobacter sputorum]
MLLCNVGNTNANFFDDGKISSMDIANFMSYVPKEKVYIINVNESVKDKISSNSNFIDLEPYFELECDYVGLGVDRIANCYAISDGAIVDAGSAITIDIMYQGVHLGGAILPGLSFLQKAYSSISPRLNVGLNTQISLDSFPQNTLNAVSYGTILPIVLIVEYMSKGKKIFFTGGDGEFFIKFFDKAIYDKTASFRGMLKIIKEKGL